MIRPYLDLLKSPCSTEPPLGTLQRCDQFLYVNGTKFTVKCADGIAYDWILASVSLWSEYAVQGWLPAGVHGADLAFVAGAQCNGIWMLPYRVDRGVCLLVVLCMRIIMERARIYGTRLPFCMSGA